MLIQPLLSPQYRVFIDNDGVHLINENKKIHLQQDIYKLIVPLINGRRTTDEIVDALENIIPAAQVFYAIMLMKTEGYLLETNGTRPEVTAYWTDQNLDYLQVREQIKNIKLNIYNFSELKHETLKFKLKNYGFILEETSNFDIVLVDDYLQEQLEEFNLRALKLKRPWILAKPTGSTIWIGPVFRPNDTACWECLAHRLRINFSESYYFQNSGDTSNQSISSPIGLPSTIEMALNMLATETIKANVHTSDYTLDNNILTFNLNTYNSQLHRLTKRPQCLRCGNKQNDPPSPINLKSNTKHFTLENGHRNSMPQETLQKYEHLVSPITGIIQSLESSSSNAFMHVYTAGQNLAMQQIEYRNNIELTHTQNLKQRHLRSFSGGKGINDIQAKVSALCEAAERYSGVYRGDEYKIITTFKELGHKAIHPNSCMNFSDYQYKNRSLLNKGQKWSHIIPHPFDEHEKISWTPLWSLTEKTFKYIPTSYCYYGYTDSQNKIYCIGNSNGSAAGNTVEEAIFQGFMELVERDAVAIWWYNRIKRPTVDFKSFNIEYINNLYEYYQTVNREMWILDITHDLNIPTFVAISRNFNQPTEDIIFGFGTHIDAKIALVRAVTEMNQFYVLLPYKDYKDGEFDKDILNWWNTASLENQPHFKPEISMPRKEITDYPIISSQDILKDLQYCKSQIEGQGMEMLVLDQTRPDISLPVVKVIVPGMRHFWNNFAPGRLYDVPMKMGWLQKSLKEKSLNPVMMFI